MVLGLMFRALVEVLAVLQFAWVLILGEEVRRGAISLSGGKSSEPSP